MKFKFDSSLKYILLVFMASRLILGFIGISSQMIWADHKDGLIANAYSDNKFINIWAAWDSAYYLGIAENGYSTERNEENQSNLAFFPLYPILIKLTSFISGDTLVAGLIVSNFCLLLSAFYLFKLTELFSGSDQAYSAVLYLMIFPASFILSGVFSESLFLLFLLMSFYFAERDDWLKSSISGFFLALSRPLGVLMLLPLLYIYLRNRGFSFKKIRVNFFSLALIPLGFSLFSLYIYRLSGSFTYYWQLQRSGWGHGLSNPLSVLIQGLSGRDIFYFISAFITILLIIILVYGAYRSWLHPAYYLAAAILVLVPLAAGISGLNSMLRYWLPVLPVYVILAAWGSVGIRMQIISITLASLQAMFMVFWVGGFHLIV